MDPEGCYEKACLKINCGNPTHGWISGKDLKDWSCRQLMRRNPYLVNWRN
jgi:hypothetical protein